MQIPVIDQETLESTLDWVDAVDALEEALRNGTAPGTPNPRSFAPTSAGELILMPGEVGDQVGVKIVSVAPDNPAIGHPRIQGLHLAFDGATLAPTAVLDAISLTLRRTAGVSALAVRHLAPATASRLLVFGTGPQSAAHAAAIHAVRPLTEVVVVGRRPDAVAASVAEIEALGLTARAGTAADVAGVDIIACCTTASEPLFDSSLLRPEATVVAIGSHDPDRREVDTDLVRRATVVVESYHSGLSQAGDVIMAIGDGVAREDAITGELPALARGEITPTPGAPRFFKSVGEGWCDVVVAAATIARWKAANATS